MREARERYDELVRLHQRRACRIALHLLRDDAEADEAVQDAFVKAYRHLELLPPGVPFEAWLDRILINQCLDRIRFRRVRRLYRPIVRRWFQRPSARPGSTPET